MPNNPAGTRCLFGIALPKSQITFDLRYASGAPILVVWRSLDCCSSAGYRKEGRVVGAYDLNIWVVLPVQFAEPMAVGLHPYPVEGDKAFHRAQGDGDGCAMVDLAVVVEGVSAVQNPVVAGVDGDGSVTAGVTRQSN
jgi:hypothetical protein